MPPLPPFFGQQKPPQIVPPPISTLRWSSQHTFLGPPALTVDLQKAVDRKRLVTSRNTQAEMMASEHSLFLSVWQYMSSRGSEGGEGLLPLPASPPAPPPPLLPLLLRHAWWHLRQQRSMRSLFRAHHKYLFLKLTAKNTFLGSV